MINTIINEEKDLGTARDLDEDNFSKEENAKLLDKKEKDNDKNVDEVISRKLTYLENYRFDQEFHFEENNYDYPSNFLNLQNWKKVNNEQDLKKKGIEDVCLESKMLKYQLNYTEVYGRLLGNDELVGDKREKELNDEIINASISTMTHYAYKEIWSMNEETSNENSQSEEMNVPEVYIATTFLHRYFSEENLFNMNNTKLCFYGISRGDDGRDNPNFLSQIE